MKPLGLANIDLESKLECTPLSTIGLRPFFVHLLSLLDVVIKYLADALWIARVFSFEGVRHLDCRFEDDRRIRRDGGALLLLHQGARGRWFLHRQHGEGRKSRVKYLRSRGTDEDSASDQSNKLGVARKKRVGRRAQDKAIPLSKQVKEGGGKKLLKSHF